MKFKTFLEMVNKSDIPAYLRKNDKMTTKDLEKERTQNRSHPETIKKINGTVQEEVLDEANHREFASQSKMHPEMAKHMTVGSEHDYYEPKTGDKVSGKVMKNDGKEVHVKQTHDSYNPKKAGTVHKFTIASKLEEGRMKDIATNAQETDRLKKKDDVPFDGPYTKTPATTKDKSGAVHTAMSRAKHLAKQAMKNVKEEVELEEGYDKSSEHHKNARKMAKDYDGKATFHPNGHAEVRMRSIVHGYSTLNPKGTTLMSGEDLANRASKEHGKGKVQGNVVHFKEAKDEVEHIHELDQKTLKSYINKNIKSGRADDGGKGDTGLYRATNKVAGKLKTGTLDNKVKTLGNTPSNAHKNPYEYDASRSELKNRGVHHFAGRRTRTEELNMEEKDEQEYGYEGDMALNQLATLTRCAEMIKDCLKPDTDLPEWVQSKITLATDYIQTAADYLYSESEVNEGYYEKPASAYRRKGDEVRDPTPVAPVPAKKYIKGTPENKAARAARKPINGMPTNVKSEELKGNQHKIDKNKNGKIDAHDFKLLRKEEEQLDELSKGTLGSYIKKASNDLANKGAALGKKQADADEVDRYTNRHMPNQSDARETMRKAVGAGHDDINKVRSGAIKRNKNIGKAVDRLSKEEFENGELETMSKSYKQFVESLNEIKMSDLPSRKVSGKSYGAQYHDDEGDDEEEKPKAKPAADAVKRGRGRPAGSKSGARQSGSAVKSKNGADYTGYKLHLPNKN